jgi:hypothetical protein
LYDVGHVGDISHQSHDFEPGIAPSGLFWTIPITPSAIDVDPGRGRARLYAVNVPVTDYHDFINAVFGGGPTPIPSRVSFDVRWPGDGDRQKIRDETFGFTGHYVTSAATINFSASNVGGGVIFSSDPSAAQNNVGSPGVGHERNGVFFQ